MKFVWLQDAGADAVAPCAGAWIEISFGASTFADGIGRPLRGGVD